MPKNLLNLKDKRKNRRCQKCRHVNDFSINITMSFVDFHPKLPSEQYNVAVVARVFAGLSALGAALTVATLMGFPILRANKSRRNIVYGAICVFISHLSLAIGDVGIGSKCTFQGIINQYFVMASFAWSTCIATETWRAVSKRGSASLGETGGLLKGMDLYYHLVAWFIPAIITLSAALGGGYARLWTGWCWVSTTRPVTLSFMIPALVAFVYNVTFAVMVIVDVNRTVTRAKAYRHSDTPISRWTIPLQVRIFLGMCVTFGLVFIFHIILWIAQPLSGSPPMALFVLDAIFTYSIGILLFFSILRNRAVIAAYRRMFGLPHTDTSAEDSNQATRRPPERRPQPTSDLGAVGDPIEKYRSGGA